MPIIKEIPVQIDKEKARQHMRIRSNKSILDTFEEVYRKIHEYAKPKGMYFKAPIVAQEEDGVTIENKRLFSRHLAESTKDNRYLYPYVITCGMELEEYYQKADDLMEQFMIDGMSALVLEMTTDYIADQIKKEEQIENLAYHIPGALNDWDMEEQIKIFDLFEDVEKEIGVTLSESYIMRPSKSVSGVYYEQG
ncbi:MAG TPA: hypothetical protein DHN33_02960 [Eubacteriaceae bacterium]|nr:hypothetical protein [Eubacteriaceae bacterium]